MQRIGIFGGTYDPPHVGHIQAATRAICALGLSKLIMIPSYVAPHKQNALPVASPAQRLQMLRLLAAQEPRIEVSDMEIRRGGVSYSYETVLQLKKEYPEAELVLLMGTDMFLSFADWKDPDVILRNASLGVFYRGLSKEKEAVARQKELLEARGAQIYLTENAVVDISSTQLKRLLVFRGASPFLDEKVKSFILDNGLYSTDRDYKNLPVDELEQVVVSLLNPNRVAHVLGCRRTAVELAKRWGADPVDAERAALLHDITKALDGQLQLTLCREYGVELDGFSKRYPKTLHAMTGSLVAQRIFGENQAVVDAICCHTTGKARMNMLEMIIYVADYMEPNRNFPGVEELRYLTTVDMRKALAKGLQMTISVLKENGSEISPASQQALESLGVLL